jgi:methylenetetrahydrofolate reductase (NADPH)
MDTEREPVPEVETDVSAMAPAEARFRPGSSVAGALTAAQFEVIPLRGAFERASVLPAGACVTVTSSPSKGLEPTLELAERLAAARYAVVPHMAARSLRDRAHLGEVVARLAAAGIRRAFVVAGDGEEPGAYPDGLSLLRALDEAGRPFDDAGVPGYPEGHPLIADGVLLRALLDKQRFASSMTTQLCFDPEAVRSWVARMRRSGVRLPMVLGLPGPADLARVAGIAAKIGVADSARYVRKNRGVLGAVLRRRAFRPDPLFHALASLASDPVADVRGIHLFTFNQVEAAAAWRTRALASARLS